MAGRDFWTEDCPARGAALSHVHWDMCYPATGHPGTGDKHAWTDCCHCGMNAAEEYNREKMFREAGLPPVDVEARMRSLGLISPTPYDRPDEPKMATGSPAGVLYDGKGRTNPGRGPLTVAQQRYLTAIDTQLAGRY